MTPISPGKQSDNITPGSRRQGCPGIFEVSIQGFQTQDLEALLLRLPEDSVKTGHMVRPEILKHHDEAHEASGVLREILAQRAVCGTGVCQWGVWATRRK